MQVLTNIGLLVTPVSGRAQGELLSIKNAAIAWHADKIVWVGAEDKLPAELKQAKALNAQGALVIPGLIDCHTHLAFAGWRADEFEKKIVGTSYLEIAQQGGGIMSTVRATRAASFDDLLFLTLKRIEAMSRLGVTTVEAKSGYGLTLADEIKLLEVYQAAAVQSQLTVLPTFLGAHTIPIEYRSERAKYVALVTEQMIPQVAQRKLALFCDIFVEQGAFSADEARSILAVARNHGLKLKLHVDQLSDGAGGKLAAEVKAVSADHLEHISDQSIEAMVQANVVGVTLPIATLYTREKALDARRLLNRKVGVAVATDFNPGTAPSYHLPFAMLLACTLNRMTPSEVVDGATRIAARALGIEQERGAIEVGKYADFAVIDSTSVEHWLYHFLPNACVATIKNGVVIHGRI